MQRQGPMGRLGVKRWALAAAAVASLATLCSACASWLPDGTVRLSHRCPQADTLTVSIDGRVAGTVAPSSVGDFAVRPGDHTVTAQSANGYRWKPRSVHIMSAQVAELYADCP